ncbi:hypothetical protein H7849_06115 [Alloacidobacterium dinghuense]|uniref:DUF6265 domain-containing protein n=1 Tax=Alloacidobacterium dinghuense TaxID=2763107 RepID=A0A7G8BLU9_9BACT|nr:DUF6265 family protein [Alloacidobacterium dinghuense]QNI33519.1 hypothetical protein H7849_06115 [Alloacidobacterium dinghuense]
MKVKICSRVLFALFNLFLFATVAVCETDPPAVPVGHVSDLAFLAGRWQGTVDSSKIAQVCDSPDASSMVCIFHLLNEAGKLDMIEVYTLRDTPEGVVEKVRFFSPELGEEAGTAATTMKLVSVSSDKLVFENPNGTYPKRSTIYRTSADAFTSKVELIDAKGVATEFEAYWHRVS